MNGSFPIVIIGAGGHGMVLASSLLRAEVPVLGFVDAEPALHGKTILGVPVLGGDDLLADSANSHWHLVNGIGSIGRPARRREIFERLKGRGFAFYSVVDPTAIIGPEVEIGEGAQILAGCVIQPGCYVGRNSIVNTRASIDHDVTIGAHVHIAPGAVLSGNVVVGDEVHVGTGACVKQGVRIASGAVVGVGAAVVGDVAQDSLVAGVPAKPLTTD